jgi:hypothetical protein
MHPKKTVAELLEISQSGMYAVCAEVVRIIDGQDWWYPACKCHRSVLPNSGAYFCSGCDKHMFQVIPRYVVSSIDLVVVYQLIHLN